MKHGEYLGVCYFIPGKVKHETGMPDWNNEQSKNWGTLYDATEKGWVDAIISNIILMKLIENDYVSIVDKWNTDFNL